MIKLQGILERETARCAGSRQEGTKKRGKTKSKIQRVKYLPCVQ